MRVLHLSTGISKQSAAYRLHRALLNNGIESFVYTGLKSLNEKEMLFGGNELKLKITAKLERLLLNLYPQRSDSPWNLGFFNNCLDEVIDKVNPDIIHLHWINQFVSIKHIAKFNRPVVWTMHDSWAFTGGCHLPSPCEKFRTKCEHCPQLNSKQKFDLSTFIFNLKKKSWEGANINIIGPSKWITESAKSSVIFSDFPVSNIPNCIDTDFFTIKDCVQARQRLNLPLNKKIVLFGAHNAKNDTNKGYDLLKEAFEKVGKERDDIELVIFGSKEKSWDENSGIREIGFINDPAIFPWLYSAADIVISASRSENFSNVILESLSCGTPVVAFNIGGNSDLVVPDFNGDLVTPYNVEELALIILKSLKKEFDKKRISDDIKNKFNESAVALKTLDLYRSLIL